MPFALSQRGEVDWRFPISVERLVTTVRYVHLGWLGRVRPEDRRIVAEVMRSLGLAGLAGRQIGRLSGGQQQRALLARALVQGRDRGPRDRVVGGAAWVPAHADGTASGRAGRDYVRGARCLRGPAELGVHRGRAGAHGVAGPRRGVPPGPEPARGDGRGSGGHRRPGLLRARPATPLPQGTGAHLLRPHARRGHGARDRRRPLRAARAPRPHRRPRQRAAGDAGGHGVPDHDQPPAHDGARRPLRQPLRRRGPLRLLPPERLLRRRHRPGLLRPFRRPLRRPRPPPPEAPAGSA